MTSLYEEVNKSRTELFQRLVQQVGVVELARGETKAKDGEHLQKMFKRLCKDNRMHSWTYLHDTERSRVCKICGEKETRTGSMHFRETGIKLKVRGRPKA